MPARAARRDRLPLLLPLAALLAVFPLLLRGCSCGHDFTFHLLSWMESARQFRHGTLHPQWDFSAAWNAGEPRFLFYPPLSWTLGALLGLLTSWSAAPILYTWLVLTAAGFSMYCLARSIAAPAVALLAATFYLANPYMLFTAYERTAYAELLAAAWIPLLFLAALRPRIHAVSIALPLALLWITNAPAAVIGSYALAFLLTTRLILHLRQENSPQPTQSFTLHATLGTLLGIGLAAFYILPAAHQRRYVQIAMAIIPSLRIQDNTLFHHTGDPFRDAVIHTASLLAILLLAFSAATLLAARSALSTTGLTSATPRILALLTILIAFLLTPLAAPIWRYAPQLAFLQFPWRILVLLAAGLGLALAIALSRLALKPGQAAIISPILAAILIAPAYYLFAQPCDETSSVPATLSLFRSGQGTEPTDEYTPVTADNDALQHNNPPYWLTAPDTAPSSPPHSLPPGPAPLHLDLEPAASQTLILNLRDFPAWHITRNGQLITDRLERDDGLIAIPLPAGAAHIDVTYVSSGDRLIGNSVTLLSLAIVVAIEIRRRLRPSTS